MRGRVLLAVCLVSHLQSFGIGVVAVVILWSGVVIDVAVRTSERESTRR